MAYPTVAVKFSPSTTRFATPTYVTLPATHVEGLDVQTGRQSELDGLSPGTLTVDLDGSSRVYDPNYAAGTYYPNLTPGKRVQVTATFDENDGAAAITYVGIGAIASGSNVSLTPALPGGWAEFDLLLILASIRNSGTGTVDTPTGWTALLTSGNVALLGRIARTGDTVEAARNTPTITFAGGVANATVTARCWAFRGTERDITLAVSASVQQLNGSSQNITIPGLTITEAGNAVVVAAWKQDDWTAFGAATLSGQGFAAIADDPVTFGDDAGVSIQYKIETTAANFVSTFITITGGASAINRGMVIALRPYRGTTYQLFNGWTDGWPGKFHARVGHARMKATGPFGILARTTTPDPYTAAVEADTPTAWYRLNEGAGQVLTDSSGNGHHGRWVPELADVSTTDGLVVSSDKAVSLPAAPTFAVGKVPKSAVPSLAPFTVECWVRIDKVPGILDTAVWAGLLDRGGVSLRVYNTLDPYPGTFSLYLHTDDAAGGVPSQLAVAASVFYTAPGVVYSICDGRPHHLVCTINAAGNDMHLYVDGVEKLGEDAYIGGALTGQSAWGDIDINFLNSWDGSVILDELAFYNSELSITRAVAHYTAGALPYAGDTTGARIGHVLDLIGWPADLRDVDGGQSILGAGNVSGQKTLGYLDRVAVTEQGLLSEGHDDNGKVRFVDRTARLVDLRSTAVQTVFSDQTADLTTGVAYSAIELANDDRPAANAVTVSWRGGDVTVRDQSSVDSYGEIPVSLDTLLETSAEATNLAEWVLTEQSALFTRIRAIEVRPSRMNGTAAARAWVACLARREGDRVRVIHQPAWLGATISQQLWVIGKEHRLGNGVEDWSTTFWFGPATTTAYWILGTSLLGSTTRLSY